MKDLGLYIGATLKEGTTGYTESIKLHTRGSWDRGGRKECNINYQQTRRQSDSTCGTLFFNLGNVEI